jgi:hypothetical protein
MCAQEPTLERLSVPGYIALVRTPLAALPPYLPRDLVVNERSPTVFHLRYGLRRDDSTDAHTVAGTLEFPLGGGNLGMTAGVQTDPQNTILMAGAEYQAVFSRGLLTPSQTGPVLVLTMRSAIGFGTTVEGDSSKTLFAAGFSIPMSVPIGTDIVIIPFAAPGLQFGLVSSNGKTEAEPRVTIGAGLVIHNPSRLDLTLGVNRVLLQEGRNVFGIGLTLNR